MEQWTCWRGCKLLVFNCHSDTALRRHAAVRDNKRWRDKGSCLHSWTIWSSLHFQESLSVLSVAGHLIHDDNNRSCSGQTPTLEGRWLICVPLSAARASGTRWMWMLLREPEDLKPSCMDGETPSGWTPHQCSVSCWCVNVLTGLHRNVSLTEFANRPFILRMTRRVW